MGCDDGVLLSDKAFGGADTWATAYTISLGIQKLGGADLILCGERATDGDTGQVGPWNGSHAGTAFIDLCSKDRYPTFRDIAGGKACGGRPRGLYCENARIDDSCQRDRGSTTAHAEGNPALQRSCCQYLGAR